MGIKRFFKNKIKDRNFIRNKRKLKINHYDLDFFKNYTFDFIACKNPEVSIIIPVYNQIRYTLNCLYTLDQYDRDIQKEIIIINDKSTDDTLDYLKKIKGITVIDNPENLGFLKNVNKGIEEAKGKYVYLLNNDVEVQENYLSSLLNVFSSKDKVGAVGSKMIFADNTLQEAGCLIFENTEIVNLGRGEAIDTPKYNFLRKVDYCSGCSLLFHKLDVQGNVNLLDEAFLPAYYEETDLCQRLKYEQGLDIYYQPSSEIIHFENISYTGKDNSKELLLQRNRETFMSRWNKYFTNKRYLDKENTNNLNAFYKKPNILILEEFIPKPDKDSGSRRFLEIIKILQKNHHRIILAVKQLNEDDDIYVHFFRSIGVEVCKDFVNTQDKIVKISDQVHEALHFVDIVWIFRPTGFDFWYKKIKDKLSGQKIIYDMVDLHYLRMERENEYIPITKNRKKEMEFFRETEYTAMQKADVVVSISDEEKKIVSQKGIKNGKIFTVSNIHEPVKTQELKYSERENLLFIGGFYHMPNMDAVKFLYESIMPLVWAKDSTIKINILGPDFPEEIKEKYNSDHFRILGYQKSVDYWFENSRIFVAPLRYGAGVKGKIGQALEFALPVITTFIGAEGMGLVDRETALVSENNAQVFADKILELYHNEGLWNTLHQNSPKPLAKFSVDQQEKNIKKMFEYLGFENN
ncbi:Glycosyltransferase, GT2 family [Chryseobacterium taichungense]|uniref:Glycosyltransferase, GT2 family n=1 Tax=Chryseobacterium taichungense TaxID=295069 RepID=A0A1H7WGC0_9FLAO|nr:glycosyltransferase [Chryseobacterium taichungense]SEM20520.1 Glycosyltransferase, GT2 family [Chryseobacterium taichungense]